jgi:hypothetical protein
MKAAGIERFGDDVRELSLPDPRPAGAGETLITVRAAGVAEPHELEFVISAIGELLDDLA